jgi:hypothetical protein
LHNCKGWGRLGKKQEVLEEEYGLYPEKVQKLILKELHLFLKDSNLNTAKGKTLLYASGLLSNPCCYAADMQLLPFDPWRGCGYGICAVTIALNDLGSLSLSFEP